MRRKLVIAIALVVIGVTTLSGQSSLPTASDGLELLQRVSQHYSDAKSYYIEAVEEQNFANEFERSWQKTLITGAETPGDRYHYEGHSSEGGALKVADGRTVWTYHIAEHQYTQKAVSDKPTQPSMIHMAEMSLMRAEGLRKDMGDLAKHLKSATRLEDTSLSTNRGEIPCYRVRIQTADMKRMPPDYTFEKTLWIDKVHETVARIVEHAQTYVMIGSGRIAMQEDTTTVFPVVELDRPVRDSFFSFSPPSDAKLVQEFPAPGKMGPDLSGEQAPSLSLKSAEGKVVSLDAFRGKPVLLEIWATWCAPCVKNLEHVAHIYAEANDKGLVVISVDQDEEAKTATDFLKKKGYAWPNFHDDGEISKALGASTVPRVLLINEEGRIVYDGGVETEDELRSAMAKLGPTYAYLAPKPQKNPCSISK